MKIFVRWLNTCYCFSSNPWTQSNSFKVRLNIFLIKQMGWDHDIFFQLNYHWLLLLLNSVHFHCKVYWSGWRTFVWTEKLRLCVCSETGGEFCSRNMRVSANFDFITFSRDFPRPPRIQKTLLRKILKLCFDYIIQHTIFRRKGTSLEVFLTNWISQKVIKFTSTYYVINDFQIKISRN